MTNSYKAWSIWHPEKGFGDAYQFHACGDMDEAVRDCRARQILDDDERWHVIPVQVKAAAHLENSHDQ